MKYFIIVLLISPFFVSAQEVSQAKITKLSEKGKKIVNVLCDESKLPSSGGTIDEVIAEIKTSKACPSMSKAKLEAVAYFINNGSTKKAGEKIVVPEGSKCPVCGMFVSKYPKWVALIEVEGKKNYFDGVKDMMKFYIFDADFPYDRAKISSFLVSDFYTLNRVDAKKAFYVIGSDVFGPMGDELIPFSSQKAAQNFMMDHAGRKIVSFEDISPKMIMALDGIEYNK